MTKILIPSRGRHHLLDTLVNIPEKFHKDIIVFVPKEELEKYRFAFQTKFKQTTLRSVSSYLHSIAEKRMLMVKWFQQNYGRKQLNENYSGDPKPFTSGEAKFIMMDDDLRFSKRSGDGTKLVPMTTEEDFQGMFDTWEEAMDVTGASACGISMRQGNNNMPANGVDNTRCIRCVMFTTSAFLDHRVIHGRVPVMEDFDVMLQMLRLGYDNHVVSLYAQDQKGTGTVGGCSVDRTLTIHNASAEKLAELHPNLVKLRIKENKGGPEELRIRKEVTIYWKKARASANV